ncbi:MAG: GTP 3',8-cyclase MoaA [Planctomycetaceae bacterium]
MPGPATLADKLGRLMRDLRISVTDRCNFRCPYCMPSEIFGESYEFLPRDQILTFEEIARLARLFLDRGVRKLRLTGGEPLLRQELPRLVAMLARMPGVEDVSLTTNGVHLAGLARELASAGLRRVTVSLDSLDPAVFAAMNGRGHAPERVLEGIAAAEAAGLAPLKINCVVVRGTNDATLVELARRFHGTGHIVRFIEYMDVGTRNGWNLEQVVTGEEIAARIGASLPLERIAPNYAGEVATRWKYRDGGGEIGIITSVSAPFCATCTRARLTTDGRLVTCLFAAGGADLRGPLRSGASDSELGALIDGVWTRRSDRYSEERSSRTEFQPRPRIEMYQVGG